jgi:hypothetical protein
LKDEVSQKRKIGATCFARLQKLANEEKAIRQARMKLKRNAIKGQTTIFEMLGDEGNEKKEAKG